MDSMLMTEEPLIKKCCYDVIPLRSCLLKRAIRKLAVDQVAIAYMALAILMMFVFGGKNQTIVALFLVLAVDIGFLTALTVGILYQKKIYLIRVFSIYEWVAMAVETAFIMFILVKFAEAGMYAEGILVIVIGITYILLDLCIIVTLKSHKMVKLRNKNQFDFSRIPHEGEVTAN